MAYGYKCSIYGCMNYANQKDRKSFFRFPQNEDLLKKWVIACERKDFEDCLATKPPKYFAQKGICSEHFEPKCFKNKNLPSQGLWPGSLPTLKLYSQSEIFWKYSLTVKQFDNMDRRFMPEFVSLGNACETSNVSNTNITHESNLDNSEKSLPESASSGNVCDPLNPLKMEIVDECNLDNSKKLLPESAPSKNLVDQSNTLTTGITDGSNLDYSKRQIEWIPGAERQIIEKLIAEANPEIKKNPSSTAPSGSTGQRQDMSELEIQNMRLKIHIDKMKKFAKNKNSLLWKYKRQNEILKQKLKAFKGHVSLDKVNETCNEFIKAQTKLPSKRKFGRRYSEKFKEFALDLYFSSTRSYCLMQKYFLMPSKSTLLSWLKK